MAVPMTDLRTGEVTLGLYPWREIWGQKSCHSVPMDGQIWGQG